MESLQEILGIVLIGCGATALMDSWLMFLRYVGVPTLNFAYLGRWVGHLLRGRLFHAAIGGSPAVANELALGWLAHYATGIGFAAVLIGIAGASWMQAPTLMPALLTGVGTIVFPLFLMQPAMGMGIAASRSATPVRNVLRSFVNHGVFGLGLFGSACLVAWIAY